MLKFVLLIIFAMSSSANATCNSIKYKDGIDTISSDYPVDGGLTLSHTIWLPKLLDESEIIIDEGPVAILASGNSYISYRVIDKNEVEFIGSKKSPYNFFKSAFTGPKDITECSFIDGVRGIENRSYYHAKNIEFYVHEVNENITIYIISMDIDIAVEVTSKNLPREIINNIVAKTYIK